MNDQPYRVISEALIIEKLKASNPRFGLRQALKQEVKLVCVFDKYLNCKVPNLDKLLKVRDKIRVFNVETLNKIRSMINRAHKINVISF